MTSPLPFSAHHVLALRALGTVRRHAQGDYLVREGESADHVVLILRGRVKVLATARDGYDTILALRRAGEFVGEFAAFDLRPRSASVVALTEVVSVFLSGQVFRDYLRSQPDLALIMLAELVQRLREADRRRMEFGSCDVTARVCRLLLDLASGSPTVALSQQEIAGAVGASREAVSRSLRLLRQRGAVETGRQRVEILRPEVLRDLGGGTGDANPTHR